MPGPGAGPDAGQGTLQMVLPAYGGGSTMQPVRRQLEAQCAAAGP